MKSLRRQQEIQQERQANEVYRSILEERDLHRFDDIKKSMERVKKLVSWAEVSFPRPVTPSEYINKKAESELRMIQEEGLRREEKEKESKRNLDRLTREMNKDLMEKREEEKRNERMRDQELNQQLQEERRKYEELKAELKMSGKEKRLELGNMLKEQEMDKKSQGEGYSGAILEVMTPVERELNRVALDAVRTDPVLNSLFQSRISHRMRMSGGGMTARGGSTGNR